MLLRVLLPLSSLVHPTLPRHTCTSCLCADYALIDFREQGARMPAVPKRREKFHYVMFGTDFRTATITTGDSSETVTLDDEGEGEPAP